MTQADKNATDMFYQSIFEDLLFINQIKVVCLYTLFSLFYFSALLILQKKILKNRVASTPLRMFRLFILIGSFTSQDFFMVQLLQEK